MGTSTFPTVTTGVTVETTGGGLTGDGSSGNKLAFDFSGLAAPPADTALGAVTAPYTQLFAGPAQSTLPAYIRGYDAGLDGGSLLTAGTETTNYAALTIARDILNDGVTLNVLSMSHDVLEGAAIQTQTVTVGVAKNMGIYAYAEAHGAGATGEIVGIWFAGIDLTDGAVPAQVVNAYYADLGGISPLGYYSWMDSQGVRRVREDATFDSVGQAIEALYNPQFTKYTPGATNFERVILGQWNGNVAEIGTEKGGTGTLRDLRLIGANIQLNANAIVANGKAIQTDTTTAHTALIQAYDVDGTAYKTFGTLTNGNTPDFTIAPPSGGTVTVQATTYKSSDASAGITQDVTTATLVGKTMTFKNGLLTGFA